MRFPDDYHGKEVAGKDAQFEVKLREVRAPHIPEVDADFARSLGVADGDITRMRSEIKANLEREVKRRASGRIKDQVMKSLLDVTTVELPKSLVDMEVERLTANMRRDLEARGMKTDQIPMPRGLRARGEAPRQPGPDPRRGHEPEQAGSPSRADQGRGGGAGPELREARRGGALVLPAARAPAGD
jgi:hypothetical protein